MIATAKAVAIESELARRGIRLKRAGRELIGPCPICAGTDRFAVNVAKQIWNCRGCMKGGDVVDLVQHLDGISFIAAVETLTGAKLPPTPKLKIVGDDNYEQRQREKAAWLWSQRQPIIGTPAERYLREVRGYQGPLSPTLAFLPARTDHQHPAMIGAFALVDEPEPGIFGEPDNVGAVHLTLLTPDGNGKADVKPNKIVIASPRGMPLMLAPMNDLMGLAITEGIEDALSVHQATGLGAWAAGSAPFMPKLVTAIEHLATAREYDASPDCITIFVDDDDAGRRHAQELAAGLAALSAELSPTKSHGHFEIRLREAAS
jgi:CHC2 zinc finger/Toprim domain